MKNKTGIIVGAGVLVVGGLYMWYRKITATYGIEFRNLTNNSAEVFATKNEKYFFGQTIKKESLKTGEEINGLIAKKNGFKLFQNQIKAPLQHIIHIQLHNPKGVIISRNSVYFND
jgi:hypothetical protein